MGWTTFFRIDLMRPLPSLLLLTLLAGTAHAETDAAKAKARFEKAQRMFQAQKYLEAVEELQQAYVLDPKPEYLYAIAQGFRLAGDCPKAIRGYEQYLKTNPPKVDAEKAHANIERCKNEPPPTTTTTPTTTTETPPVTTGTSTTTTPVTPPKPPVDSPEGPTWTSDKLGHVLVGGGVVLGVVGTLVYMNGHSTLQDIAAADSYGDYASQRADLDGARFRERFGIVTMVVGIGCVVGGVLHYALADHGGSTNTVSASVTPSGATVSFGGSF